MEMRNIFESETYKRQLQELMPFLPNEDEIILITGASGLIGSCLIDSLLYANIYQGRKFQVYALGRNEQKLRNRFGYAKEYGDIHLICSDVTIPLPEDIQFNYIIHAASNADPMSYALRPSETLLTNVLGTKSVLDYAKDHSECRVLLTSTFEVYGDAGKKGALTEDSIGLIDYHRMRNCYPVSKICAELLCRGYSEEYGIDYVIARLCGVYGPTMSMSDSKAQAQFILNAIKGEDIVMKSQGEQIRSYCYVTDAVSAVWTILLKGKKGEAYNVAESQSIISISSFAKYTSDVSGVGIRFDLPDETEVKSYSKPVDVVMDTSKLKDLGWHSKYTYKEGIKNTISSLREIS